MNKWIKVEDELPELGVNVLVYAPKEEEKYLIDNTFENIANEISWDFCMIDGVVTVTHWQPLPDKPKD